MTHNRVKVGKDELQAPLTVTSFFGALKNRYELPKSSAFFFFSEDNRSKAKAEERWMMISTR